MAVSQTRSLPVWVASALCDLHLHRRLPRMHSRLDHRGELRDEEERRPKRRFLLDVLDDVANL